MSDGPLRLAIIGPGEIARVFAAAATDCGAARIVGVTGRSGERSARFVRDFGGLRYDGRLELLTGDGEGGERPEAVYVATPHADHGASIQAALESGVHVLCEKPLVIPPLESGPLLERARTSGLVLMEGWMYRTHPQMSALFELVADGELGSIERVESEFSFACPFDPEHRLFNFALGGGAILDVGGYPLSFALGVARAAAGGGVAPLAEARVTGADGALVPTAVIGDARATLEIGSIAAELRTSIVRGGGCCAKVIGSRASAWLEHPFLPEGRRRGREGAMMVERDGRVERRVIPSEHDCFALEAMAFRDLVRAGLTGGPQWPLVDHAESATIARLMVDWRERIYRALPDDYAFPDDLPDETFRLYTGLNVRRDTGR